MAENSKIEWTHHTFNPWEGCTKIGPGCDHCYAETRNNRFGGGNWGAGAPRRKTSESNWRLPIKWNKQAAASGVRYRVFCASLADVFDNEVDPQWREELFLLIKQTPNLHYCAQHLQMYREFVASGRQVKMLENVVPYSGILKPDEE